MDFLIPGYLLLGVSQVWQPRPRKYSPLCDVFFRKEMVPGCHLMSWGRICTLISLPFHPGRFYPVSGHWMNLFPHSIWFHLALRSTHRSLSSLYYRQAYWITLYQSHYSENQAFYIIWTPNPTGHKHCHLLYALEGSWALLIMVLDLHG